MKKVAFVINSIGGLYSFRKELVKKIRDDGNEVLICGPQIGGERQEYFEKLGCKIVDTTFDRHGKNPLKELKLISLYRKILKAEKPDIVFTYTIKPNIYCGMACAGLRIPYVANITGLGTAVENPGIMQKVTLKLLKRGLRKAQKVFFQNEANRDMLLSKKAISGDYDMLPGSGVNLEHYTLWDYPKGENVEFVFMSRIMKEKGINQYLAAAKAIREKHPNTVFHVCGGCEQDYKQQLEKLTEEGIIRFHGRVAHPEEMYRQCCCTIHPTYYPEGLSNVLLETCATGRPIITTDRPGCKEVVDHGVNGFVVKQKDSQDLTEKIEKFLSLSWEERKAMGLAARAKVEREFDRNLVIGKYLREIDKLDA